METHSNKRRRNDSSDTTTSMSITESKTETKPKSKKRVRKACQHVDEDGIGCTTPVQFRKGGIADRCIKHGGFPLCQHISENDER